MSDVKHFVAFSGGLDSTWILYTLLKEGHCVVPVHVSVGAATSQMLPEMLVKREMLKRLGEMFPDQIVDEEYTRLPSHPLNITDGVNWKTGNPHPRSLMRDTLIQQLCVRNALVNCLITNRPTDRFYAGWHSTDTPTTFDEKYYRDLTRLETIYNIADAKYINQFSDWANPSPVIETPAWNKSKVVMWDEVPENIRELIIVGKCNVVEEFGHNQIRMEINNTKVMEYNGLGIEVSTAFVMPYPILETDILFIHSNMSGIDNTPLQFQNELLPFFTYLQNCVKGVGERMRWPGTVGQWEQRFMVHLSRNQNFKEEITNPLACPDGRGYVVVKPNTPPPVEEVELIEEV